MTLSVRRPIGPDEVREIVGLTDDVYRNHWISYAYSDIFETVPRPLPAFGPPGVVHESPKTDATAADCALLPGALLVRMYEASTQNLSLALGVGSKVEFPAVGPPGPPLIAASRPRRMCRYGAPHAAQLVTFGTRVRVEIQRGSADMASPHHSYTPTHDDLCFQTQGSASDLRSRHERRRARNHGSARRLLAAIHRLRPDGGFRPSAR